MLTEFGKRLRKIRIDNNEILYNMAEKLQVTPVYLSTVETGRCDISGCLLEKVRNSYHLSEKEYAKLLEAARESGFIEERRKDYE